jgi:hypothetical protein
MQFFVKLSVAAAFASSIIGALAAPTNSTRLTRAPTQVITKCTVPNTVALTFDDVSIGSYSVVSLALILYSPGTILVFVALLLLPPTN